MLQILCYNLVTKNSFYQILLHSDVYQDKSQVGGSCAFLGRIVLIVRLPSSIRHG
jgi:hypothetical protein